MGLLKRFRASSSASTRHNGADVDLTPPPLPPPPIMTHSHSELYASTSRASFAESTNTPSAAGMETAKSSKSFWKRKQKGKDKEVVGLSYESLTPSPSRLPPYQYQNQNQSQPQGSRSSSFVHVPAPRRELSHGPQGDYRREGSSTPKQETTPRGTARTEPRAMLGRLDFEGDNKGPSLAGAEMYSRPAPALRTSSIPFGSTSSQQSSNGRPVTAIFLERPDKQDSSMERAGRMSQEEMEHLASPEKRDVYTPNTRRMSRSSVQDEPVSHATVVPTWTDR